MKVQEIPNKGHNGNKQLNLKLQCYDVNTMNNSHLLRGTIAAASEEDCAAGVAAGCATHAGSDANLRSNRRLSIKAVIRKIL